MPPYRRPACTPNRNTYGCRSRAYTSCVRFQLDLQFIYGQNYNMVRSSPCYPLHSANHPITTLQHPRWVITQTTTAARPTVLCVAACVRGSNSVATPLMYWSFMRRDIIAASTGEDSWSRSPVRHHYRNPIPTTDVVYLKESPRPCTCNKPSCQHITPTTLPKNRVGSKDATR